MSSGRTGSAALNGDHSTFHLRPLAGYLAGAAGTAALLAAPQADAAVTAITFGFGPVFSAADGGGYFTVGSYGTMWSVSSASGLKIGDFPAFSPSRVYHNASVNADNGLPSFFPSGTVIGAGGNGAMGYAWFQSDSYSPLDLTFSQIGQNIGFRTTNFNWGWANVTWDEATKELTINEAYVESVAGDPITINAVVAVVPEPSRALLALAGLCGVALKRCRR